jgi:flagellar hook-length control protein FliK
MKISADRSGSAPPTRTGEPSAPESKTFDKVLERKSQERSTKKGGRNSVDRALEGEDKLPVAIGPMPFFPTAGFALAAVSTAAPVPEIQVLDGLVKEIMVVAGPGTDPKVEVQFHSKTLEGLNVQIAKDGDRISIRFVTRSETVAQLLSRNSGHLSEALEAKGLHITPIQVELAPASPRPAGAGSSPRDNRRSRGDERQQRHQK